MINQVTIKNFKSFGKAVVNLERFTVLVGPNGAGKSNFVDALRFIGDCLTGSVSQSLQTRGGLQAVRRHSIGHPHNFGFQLSIDLPSGPNGDYSFEIASRPEAEFEIKRERCRVQEVPLGRSYEYEVRSGTFTRPLEGIRPAIKPDRLALPLLSGISEFRPVYDYLTSMRFYSLAPNMIRQLQEPDTGRILKIDGGNAAAVLREVQKEKRSYERLCRLLEKVVPGTNRAEYAPVGQKETIRFKQNVGDKAPWAFDALSMSDGTLRALGILLAVYQVSPPSLVAIEEPEATIHPAALEILVQVLKDGANRAQILITTHSPDLIDSRNVDEREIRAVEFVRSQTIIGTLGAIPRAAIRERLYTPGELLRAGEIEPNREEATELARQLPLFKT